MSLDWIIPILVAWPVYLACGWAVEEVVRESTATRGLFLKLGVWFLLGAGSLTLVQFVLSQVGIPLWMSFILGGIVSVGLLAKRLVNTKQKQYRVRPGFSVLWIYWILIFSFLGILFLRSSSRVMYTWDAVAFWKPKMISLYEDQKVLAQGLKFFNHPEYPLLLPIVGANAFTVAGLPNDVAAKSVIFGFSASLIFILAEYLRKFGVGKGLFFLLMLCSSFIFREHVAGEYVGTADILVGTYIAAGAVLLLLGNRKLAVLMFLLLPWVKSEGLVFSLASIGLIALFYAKLRWWIIKMAVVFLAPWRLFVKINNMDASQYFKFSEIYVRPWAEYATYSVHAFREEFRNLEKWNGIFFFSLAAVLTHVRKILTNIDLRILVIGLLLQLSSYLVIFTITPEEQASFIAAAVSRLTLHLAPIAIVVTAAVLLERKHAKTE